MTILRVALAASFIVGLVAASDQAAGPTGTAHATPETPVHVLVSKDTKPGAVTYRYRVVNGSPFEITTLLVGSDSDSTDSYGRPELRLAPIGWNGDSVPSTGARSPARWHFMVIQTEDDSLVNLEWQVDTLATGILGGAAESRFEVTLPREDPQYAGGHWVVFLNSGSRISYAGRMEPVAAPAPRRSRN